MIDVLTAVVFTAIVIGVFRFVIDRIKSATATPNGCGHTSVDTRNLYEVIFLDELTGMLIHANNGADALLQARAELPKLAQIHGHESIRIRKYNPEFTE